MNPINNIWQNAEDALRLHDPDTQARIHRICQEHYYNLCEVTNWKSLRRTKSVLFTATDTDGVYLPSDLIGIMSVETNASRIGDLSTGDATVTLTTGTTAGLAVGTELSGTDIPTDSAIASITDTTHFEMTEEATGDQTGVTITFDLKRVYYPRNEVKRYFSDGKHHWFYKIGDITPLETPVNGINISQNATTFTAKTAFSADHTGAFARFDAEPGLYEITKSSATFKTMTITPSYKGDKITNKSCVVRPKKTKKIYLIDSDGAIIADTITVYYWVYPEPLYQSYQTQMLPSSRPLELLTLISILGTMDKKEGAADVYRDELNGDGRWEGHGAMDEMISKNPIWPTG